MDFAIPNTNEKALLARAKELGSELTFLYEAKTKKELPKGGGVLIRAEKISDLKRAGTFPSKTLVIVAAEDAEIVRLACSNRAVSYVTHCAAATGRDHTHYRRGNVNQVTAKLAAENKVGYIVDFSHILELEARSRELLIGRIKQNIKVFKKYKVKVEIASFARNEYELRNPKDLEAFGRILGI